MIATLGAKADIIHGEEDINPIIDGGCSRSVGGIESAKALFYALGVQFELCELDCQPFLQGYGRSCSDAEVTIRVWNLPITDLHRNSVHILFYITNGDGFLLFGNEIIHQAYNLGPKNTPVIRPNVREVSEKESTFATHNEWPTESDREVVRTYLLVVPTKTSTFKTYFSSLHSLTAIRKEAIMFNQELSDGNVARRFANKLHTFTHFHFDGMVRICQRGRVLNQISRQAWSSHSRNVQPTIRLKVRFGREKFHSAAFSAFNQNVQLDFMFVSELENDNIFHFADYHTAISVTSMLRSRELPYATKAFEVHWVNNHGAPKVVCAHIEFMNQCFMSALRCFGIRFEPRPARRHKKLGTVEGKNSVVCLIVQRILKDAEHAQKAHGSFAGKAEILSEAKYLSKILYCGKNVSSFEIAEG